MSHRGDKKERTALVAAFLLFAAALFVVSPAEASRTTTDARSSLASSSSLELASLELPMLEPVAPADSASISPRFGFAEDLGLLDPEAGPGSFVVFAAEAAQCELTYARNNPVNRVDPDGRIEVRISPPPAETVERWTPEQRAAENLKNAQRAEAAAREGLVVGRGESRTSTFRADWEKINGPLPGSKVLDHITDLQLNGKNSVLNGQALDASVNSSNGVRTAIALRGLKPGTVITSFKFTVVGVGNIGGYASMALQALRFSRDFNSSYGRSPTIGETARFLTTGDRRSDEDATRALVPSM